MNLIVDNILDMIQDGGEAETQEDLSAFSCPRNSEIESFLHEKAIDFAKRKLSITYLVTDASDGAILGYFTLAHKALEISAAALSKTSAKKISRFAEFDQTENSFTVSAFLLAQIGKNYAIDGGQRITGDELIDRANEVMEDIQHRIGGGIIYLDVEEIPSLISFYERTANYRCFNKRVSQSDGIQYQQMIRFF